MAISVVGGANTNNFENTTCSYSPTAGNCVIVLSAQLADLPTLSTVGASATFTQLYNASPGADNRSFSAWVAFNVPAGITGFTVSTGSNYDITWVSVLEISGVSAIDVVCSSPLYNSFTTTVSTPSLITTIANDLVLACFWNENSTSATSPTNGFTLNPQASQQRIGVAYQIVSFTGTFSSMATQSEQDAGYGYIFALTGGGSSGTSNTKSLTASTQNMAGAATKGTQKGIAGTTTQAAGSVVKRTGKGIAGSTLANAASVVKQAGKHLSASTSQAAASVTKLTKKGLSAATSQAAATVVKQAAKTVTAATANWAATANGVYQSGAQALSKTWAATMTAFSASTGKFTTKNVPASTGPHAATVTRSTQKLIAAFSNTWTASVGRLKLALKNLTASMTTFNGTQQRTVYTHLSAGAALLGATVSRVISKGLGAGTALSTVALFRKIGKTINASNSNWAGTVNGLKSFVRTFNASMTAMTGGIQRLTSKRMNAGLTTLSISQNRTTYKQTQAGTAPMAGSTVKQSTRAFVASMASWLGNLTNAAVQGYQTATFTASIAFDVLTNRTTSKNIAGSQAPMSGALPKLISRLFSAISSAWSAVVNGVYHTPPPFTPGTCTLQITLPQVSVTVAVPTVSIELSAPTVRINVTT